MAYPVTLVESNPVTDIHFTAPFVSAAGTGPASNVSADFLGQWLKIGRDNTTYGRQLTFVFLTGTKWGNVTATTFHLQGYRESVSTGKIVPGKKVELGSDTQYKIAIMYINDHQLRELGIEEDADDGPFDYVRYWVSVAGTADEDATVGTHGAVYVVTGDLRYGLFGTNDQIASQMKNVGTGASAPVIIK